MLSALSALSVSFMCALTRLMRGMPGLSSYSAVFFRFLIGGAVVAVMVVRDDDSFHPNRPLLLFLRAVLGATAMIIFFQSIVEIGLAKASILIYTNPIWTALAAPIATKERPSPRLWFCLLASIGGLYLLLIPADGGFDKISRMEIAALSAGFMAGMATLTVKRLTEDESPKMIFLGLAAVGLLTTGAKALEGGANYSLIGWALLIGIGVSGAAGKVLNSEALQRIGSAECSLWSMLTPAVNCIVAAAAFGEPITGRMAAGGAIVLAACAAALPNRAQPPAEP